jgi:hypothetical protein
MLEILKPVNSNKYIVTICIGSDYLESWTKYCKNNWTKYCQNNKIGLIIITNEISNYFAQNKKNIYWQKFLIGQYLKEKFGIVGTFCFLDSDVLINCWAPNIFNFVSEDNFGLVSQKFNLPYDLKYTLKKLAFSRNKFLDNRYPLDSYLFATIENIYKLHNLKPMSNFACTGLFVFNSEYHSEIMYDWYMKYPSNIDTIDGGTEEVHLNYEIQSYGKIDWLDYKFQALWIYEMPNKYPFLYKNIKDKDLIKLCIQSSLSSNYFLHFAGRWEGDMWKDVNILSKDFEEVDLLEFSQYFSKESKGIPVGIINP